MTKARIAALAAALGLSVLPQAAIAQFFLKSPDFSGAPVSGDEPGMTLPLAGAKPDEQRAALVWNLRAGLNVAALQCQFEPSLLTLNQYNAMISDHSVEFADSFKKLTAYFKRVSKTPKEAQTALDIYGTRTYSGFSTVQGQLGFCQTASLIGRDALFTKKGRVGDVAVARLRELRNSLAPSRDLQFPRFYISGYQPTLLPIDPRCWDKKSNLRARCGGLA